MPWSNQGGGGNGGSGGGGGPWGSGGGDGGRGGGGSPWGQRPGGSGGGGGGGPTPPDIDEVIRKGQDRLRRMLPSRFGGGKGLLIGLLILLGVWGASGFYRVLPNEKGIELLFGRYTGNPTQPGLHWNWPGPIGKVYRPDVTRENRIEIGFRSTGDGSSRSSSQRQVSEESQMITGDENIVDIDFVVFWRIGSPGDFLFNLQNPEETVKMVAESVMRSMIGQSGIQRVLTEGRAEIEADTLALMQSLLSEYKAGVEVRQIQLLAVDPPTQVIDSFNEVQRARQDKDRLKNEAEAFRNDVVPRARGEAAGILAQADAYSQEVVNRAKGDANRFNSVYKSYIVSKDVTKRRIYLETMEEVLGKVNKVIIDNKGGAGVVPYLPLPEIQKRATSGDSSQEKTQ